MTGSLRLLGDVGATNARFALLDADGRIGSVRTLACDDYPGIAEAIAAYCASGTKPPDSAALAWAGPVTGDEVALTNHPWSFSIAALQRRFGFSRLLVINDFTANALALRRLAEEDRSQLGGGAPIAETPIGILGPGTGLGVGGLIPAASGWIPLAGEGGHATLPPASARESAVLDRMRQRFGHVSAERALSGPGLVTLYQTLAELAGVPAAPWTPAQIADERTGRQDPLAHEALGMFCAMLGTVAGDLALTLGARGGVYLAGGIVPRLGARFAASAFRERFEAKGRFRSYLAAIPTYVVTHPVPAFLGLAAALEGN
jgi:glucokinase